MRKPNDGGPAFPIALPVELLDRYFRPYGDAETMRMDLGGMSLRAYLVAHAPKVQEWFVPNIPKAPERDPKWQLCEGCKNGEDCIGGADCQKIQDQISAFVAWKLNKEKQTLLQWPCAWADAMISELQKSPQ